jgi:2-succinyl-6-hydroxy-2,4-cyclohexadiene-1-carboxylate synthase
MGDRLLEAGRGAPPLILLHGFTGSADSWRPLLPALGRRRRALAFDLPGHGPAPGGAPPARIDLGDCVEAVRRRLDALGIREAVLLGYSLGGRLALRFAVDHPECVRGLVLESASPGIPEPAARDARRKADHALADGIEREGLDAFVDAWMRQPLFATQDRLPRAVRDRERALRMIHHPGWLAASLRGTGQGTMAPLWDDLPALRTPVLLLAGELDAKYRDVTAKVAVRMPDARVLIVPGAGHTTHLENPEAFAAAVETFLIELDGETQGETR